MTSVLKEMHSKCLAQENDISKEISKLSKYPIDTIYKVQQKIEESLETYKDSINLLNISIDNSNISNDEKELWKRKKEIFDSSIKDLNQRLIKTINNIKIKNTKYFDFDEENGIEFGKNISNLNREKDSWQQTLKSSSEILDTTTNVNDELNSQILSLGNIGAKVGDIFHKITGSYHDSIWIKQRGQNDKYICIGLGILTIFIIGFTYFYLRPKLRRKFL